jgi:hypothetical protein
MAGWELSWGQLPGITTVSKDCRPKAFGWVRMKTNADVHSQYVYPAY